MLAFSGESQWTRSEFLTKVYNCEDSQAGKGISRKMNTELVSQDTPENAERPKLRAGHVI